MSGFKNKIVLITGGASGIGKIMGQMVLERGSVLVIWDIDREKTEATRSELSSLGRVYSYRIDVSSYDDIKIAIKWVKRNVGVVDILINNAGIVFGGFFYEYKIPDVLKTIDVNINAPMLITRELLPDMMKRNSGHICNISSLAGLLSNPKMSVYVASKWAMIGWSESLRLEMNRLRKDIRVTTVTPYYIETGMFKGVRSFIPALKPEKVARKIIRGIERNRIIVSMPWSLRFIRFSQGLMPVRFFDWFVGGLLGMYKTMDHFVGHNKD